MPSPSAPQVMVLTGAASGIGRCLAGRLSSAGHPLMLTDLDLSALERAAAQGGWNASQVRLRARRSRCRGLVARARRDGRLFWRPRRAVERCRLHPPRLRT